MECDEQWRELGLISWETRLPMDNLSLQVIEGEVRFCDLDRQSAQYQKDINSPFY